MSLRPLPIVDDLTAPYWEGAARGELLIQRCSRCEWFWHFPVELCPRCHESRNLGWQSVSGRGSVFSFIVVRRARLSWFAESVPYAVVCMELREQAGLRIFGDLLGGRLEDLEVGAPAEVRFEDLANGMSLPQIALGDSARGIRATHGHPTKIGG